MFARILRTHKSVSMTASSVDIPDTENQVIGRADAAVRCSLLATAAHCNRVEEGFIAMLKGKWKDGGGHSRPFCL